MKQLEFVVEHLGLAARDPVRLKEWYVETLAGSVVFANPPSAWLLALPGGMLLEVYGSELSRPETANNRLSGWRHVALRVASLEEARTVLAARGVRFDDPVKPAAGGGRVLFFADPEGNLLHLVERASIEPQPAKS